MTKIELIEPSKIGEYGCSPCWSELTRDVDATVAVTEVLGVIGSTIHTTYLCGNHAETINIDEKE